ncbi:hypothetical protein R3P38DRAFT_3242423 [Favolaschia claudopus]|uniref:Uncharacterized protein n=1 Tax=Favolaschia claudopus TaxID=2862362 RepID=A0AAV9Z4L5_9AGAR
MRVRDVRGKTHIPTSDEASEKSRCDAPDLLPILRWAFSGLNRFAPPLQQQSIQSGLMDVQGTYSGGGSCGIAATNFVELRAGLPIPRWQAEQSSLFRDLILQDLLLYHLIARGKTTTYSDWVVPCTHNGEVSLFTDVAVGYNDFNLNQLAPNHPIFDWIQSTAQQPAAFGPHTDVFASEPERSLAVNPKTCSNSNSSSTTDQSANSHVPLPQHDLPIRNQ